MSSGKLLDHWSPPEGAGSPVACLATTFTFEADFFTQDCMSRFLSLSTVTGEGDAISSIAALLEEENRLAEAQVSVLVDRSSPAEKRNLRWDMLPVAVPGGLLHAKVAMLFWERSARIILGSANLTSAGYRRQVEVSLAIHLDESCRIPRTVLNDLVTELRHLAGLAPGPTSGPKGRALATIDLLASRAKDLNLPAAAGRDLRLAVAPARPGVSPLDRLADVWQGAQPLSATVLSPFWDDKVPAPAVEAVRRRLTGRPASRRALTLVVGSDPVSGAVLAPSSLASQADVVAFDLPGREPRRLHAKLVLVESDEWLAAMIGSSNATEAGFGLHRRRGHHELNLWLGCPSDSRTAKHLRALACVGQRIELDEERWGPLPDEDEPTTPELPLGFVACILEAGAPPRTRLELQPTALPPSWDVRTPAGRVLLSVDSWSATGSPRGPVVDLLADEALPSYLLVNWDDAGEPSQATWIANVEDRSALPPPAELADLPVDVLLDALASTRPLPVAIEHELRRRDRISGDGSRVALDPLRRFDDSGLLLQRARQLSLALWRLQDRLGRPATNLDALHWRLHGAIGPLAIAEGLVRAAREHQTLPGEAHFLLAEVALTIDAVDWDRAGVGLDPKRVRKVVADALVAIGARRQALPPAPDAALDAYVDEALEKAQR